MSRTLMSRIARPNDRVVDAQNQFEERMFWHDHPCDLDLTCSDLRKKLIAERKQQRLARIGTLIVMGIDAIVWPTFIVAVVILIRHLFFF